MITITVHARTRSAPCSSASCWAARRPKIYIYIYINVCMHIYIYIYIKKLVPPEGRRRVRRGLRGAAGRGAGGQRKGKCS